MRSFPLTPRLITKTCLALYALFRSESKSHLNHLKAGGGESDWYGILNVDPLADYVTVKKQYKKPALLLHPDKNKFNGAKEAFNLVFDAWSLLSDHSKRAAYDEQRKYKEQQQKHHKGSKCRGSRVAFQESDEESKRKLYRRRREALQETGADENRKLKLYFRGGEAINQEAYGSSKSKLYFGLVFFF
ncbi:unnamed protein product [Brassica rapa]|uniref:J domain-containing protein n=1 Tax=Brassica campestris TaxID=3711 RepID=A0A8D9HC19_BRACM|nr:unnamed protein product [Brassica rapa]